MMCRECLYYRCARIQEAILRMTFKYAYRPNDHLRKRDIWALSGICLMVIQRRKCIQTKDNGLQAESKFLEVVS